MLKPQLFIPQQHLSSFEREKCGISDNLIRIAVGLEHIDDLKADLELALATI